MAKGTINKVILVGNLGNDPETRYMPNGTAVVNFSVATTEVKKGQDGNNIETTEWHRITVYDKLAEIAGEYLKKGSKVYLEGRIQSRKYQDKDGIERTVYNIVCNTMVMLGSKDGNAGAAADNGHQKPAASKPSPYTKPAPFQQEQDVFDDIPFARPAALDGLAFPNDGAWFGNGPMFPYGRK